jgi:hypothetical protein
MKRFGALISAVLFAAGAARAEVALLYRDAAAVAKNDFTIAAVVDGGVVVNARVGMGLGSPLVGGADGVLRNARLSKLDADADVALFRPGDAVPDAAAQNQFTQAWAAVQTVAGTPSSGPTPAPAVPAAAEAMSVSSDTAAFSVLVNGQPSGGAPIEIRTKLHKAPFTLSIAPAGAGAVWAFTVKVSAEPELSFWRTGRKQGLNDVPRPLLRYDHQAIFRPVAVGKSIELGVEATNIKDQNYTIQIEVESKNGRAVHRFPVVFTSK